MGIVKAAICKEFGEALSVENVILNEPQTDEVEVSLEACAVCHSDITFMDGGWGGDLPAVYGHEAVGRISKIGTNVSGYNINDRVLLTLIRACGSCAHCASGAPTQCNEPYDRINGPLKMLDGGQLEHGLACGAFAEKAVVHQSQIIGIPESIPAKAACLLSCGVITGVGAVVNTAGVRPGENVIVVGAGGVGLNTVQAARISGAQRIIAIDVIEEKLKVAKEFGATDVFLASEEKPWKIVKKITNGRMAQAVFVTVGSIEAFESAARYLSPGGKIYIVGMPRSGDKAKYELVILGALSQSLIGSKMGETILKRDIPWLVDLYSQGRLKLDELVSGTWSLEQINEAVADTKTGSARRNVIVF